MTITGKDLIELAESRIGEEYIYGANVDIFDPDWHGPWDCAEFATWIVYQVTGKVYGCVDNGDTEDLEPYTGGWKRDVVRGVVKKIPVAKTVDTPGALILRYRQGGKHIVFSCGNGRTIEAKSSMWGVCRAYVGSTWNWDYGILVSGVKYEEV